MSGKSKNYHRISIVTSNLYSFIVSNLLEKLQGYTGFSVLVTETT